MSTEITAAETASIDAARAFLTSLGEHLQADLQAKVATARATLTGRRIDATTLGTLDRIHAHIAAMAATCSAGVEHLDTYHGTLEQAVNATPEAADTDFYRPDTTAAAGTAPAAATADAGPAEPSGRDLPARTYTASDRRHLLQQAKAQGIKVPRGAPAEEIDRLLSERFREDYAAIDNSPRVDYAAIRGSRTTDEEEVGDVLGYANNETCFGTDQVTGTGDVPTNLALMDYPDDGKSQVGAFVEVATPKDGYDPTTGLEGNGSTLYCPPQLSPKEAEGAAKKLEELADMVDSGYRPPEPTKHTRARQRVELLLAEDRAGRGDRINVGEESEFPLTVGELLKLLTEADPTLSSPQTRHAVRAKAAVKAGGEDGTLWLDLEPVGDGTMQVVVTAAEGTENPDDDYNRQYAAHHTPASARELARKLRTFARAASLRSDAG
jgi:hypothetical protein